MILKCPLFLVPFPYEVNSNKFACKSVPFSKPKPIPIVFIWLREGPLWPTGVHAQGPQLFVSKPHWHAPSIVVKKYYGAFLGKHYSLPLQRYKDTVRCGALGQEVQGQCQQQLTQTLIVRLLKTHFFTPILDCEKSTEKKWVSDKTWKSVQKSPTQTQLLKGGENKNCISGQTCSQTLKKCVAS